jgi:hypothetical protein
MSCWILGCLAAVVDGVVDDGCGFEPLRARAFDAFDAFLDAPTS